MKKALIIIIIVTQMACHSTINIPTTNTTTMEKFDIETFNKNKVDNEWDIEGELVNERRVYDSHFNTYTEFITYKKEFYCDFRKFYSNGNLKERGKHYDYNDSFFAVGIWEYYDIDGKLIKTVDEDAKLKMNYKQAFKIAKENSLYPENVYVFYQLGYWYMYNVKGNHIGRGIEINATNGKYKIMQFSNKM